MSNNGKLGEKIFSERMVANGYIVNNVSTDEFYFDKDIDFFCISPNTQEVRSFEVKWDEKISTTNNLFLEVYNPRSAQWNGEGWWAHCKADFLAYGDAINKILYCFPLDQLRERVKGLRLRYARTWDYSEGWLCPLDAVKDLAITI